MMKKIVYFFAIVTAIVGLTACNHQQQEVKQKTSVTEPKDVTKSNKEVVEEKNEQPSKAENTTKQNEPVSQVPADTVYHNEVFKDVVVTESGDQIIVTGKAQVFEGVFQYTLYDGDKVLIENNYQTEGAPAWSEFKIIFKKELVSTNGTKFELFVYSAKDGSKVNNLVIPISKP